MGEHPLYKVDVTVEAGGFSGLSDSWSHMFGFRHIASHIDTATNGRYTFRPLKHHSSNNAYL